MAQNYYTVDKAAEVLGVTADEVRAMRERREIYGYRDGSTWKFKAEDIDKFARQRANGGDEEEPDVLLSELALGGSSASRSGSILPMEDDLAKPGSQAKSAPKQPEAKKPEPIDEQFDLADEDTFTLADSSVGKSGPKSKTGRSSSKSNVVGDDEMVLGGSGGGSDITMGGDSGINLLDPADSGLSLEAPVQISSGEESLELGEDDMISLSNEPDAKSPTDLKTDEEFLLTPAAGTGEEEDSESGSQVIALDGEASSTDPATMVGTPSTAAMVAMLDDEAGISPLTPLTPAATVAVAAAGMAAVAPTTLSAVASEPMVVEAPLPEKPFSGLQVFGLSACAVLLVLCGIMVSEVVRTMGSWDSPGPVASTFLSKVLSLVDGGH